MTLGESMVGLGRLELPTSPLSGVRSNHLSYRPTAYEVNAILSFPNANCLAPRCRAFASSAILRGLEFRPWGVVISRHEP
jgi:hypothetical protein